MHSAMQFVAFIVDDMAFSIGKSESYNLLFDDEVIQVEPANLFPLIAFGILAGDIALDF
jgi:hypothetical protein